jgi:SAM-dependent methyltransferase
VTDLLARTRTFWEGKTSPLHASSSEEFFAVLGREARFILDRATYSSVLEIGCGTGSLYRPAGFAGSRYRGIDLSESMLGEFRRAEPGVDLVCASGHDYVCGDKFDLIFTLGVIQYFSHSMLEQHLTRARDMLTPGGRVVHMHVPLRALLLPHAMGWLSQRPRNAVLGLAATIRYLLPHPMGRWYSVPATLNLGERLGFQTEFFGSMVHPYKGSFVFSLPPSGPG